MELRHLRYFVFVAEELHFGRAAERAGIAQPPLSQQIRTLEAELGVRLFNRTRRRVELTDAGKAFLPEARKTLRQAERSVRAARDGADGVAGRVTVGFVGSLAFGIVPDLLKHQHADLSDIRLELQELTSEQQRAALRAGEIDLGLIRYPIVEPAIESLRIATDPLVVAVPATHSLSNCIDGIPVEHLQGIPFVMFPRAHGPAFFDQIIALCRDAGFTPDIVQEATQMATIVAIVSAGIGVAIVPRSVARIALDGVEFRPLHASNGQQPGVDVTLARSANRQSAMVDRVAMMVQRIAHDARVD
jgi:DNA-binding transcriptional LysR family regulator